jgi:uroporphyrinogen decarboxylase
MTSKERVMRVVSHQRADRTPIAFDAEVEVYEQLHRHFKTDKKEQLYDALNVDTWMIVPTNVTYPESEKNKREKTSIWGFKSRVTAYQGGSYDEIFYNPLAESTDVGDIKRHPWPERDTLGFSHFTAEADAQRNRATMGVFTWGPYFIASFVRGLEGLLMDMASASPFADHLISTIAERSEYFLTLMLEEYGKGIDIVFMPDDTCSQSGPLFSPELFRKYVAPYLRRLTDLAHKHGKKFMLHTCGSVRAFIPSLIDCGVDILEPIQVRATGMDPALLKRDFGRDLSFCGGVDLQQVIRTYSPTRVAEEVRRLIEILGADGGYIIGPGHTYIQPDAPLANILAMYEAAAGVRFS